MCCCQNNKYFVRTGAKQRDHHCRKTACRIRIRLAISLMIGLAWSAEVAALDWPGPPDPLKLPAPRGLVVEFVPVFLETENEVLGTTKFTMGMARQNINESPTEIEVGGSFRTRNASKTDWFYYMAKTEVTADLFNAVMRSAGQPARAFSGSGDLPAVGLTWLEVQNFLANYNRWLADKAGDLLPHDEGGMKAFVRLPTEAEWEFAARGGRKVSAEVFRQKTPYGGAPLEQHEWFGGPTSSYNKLQPVGRLKANPLGLHDMLGNASEMTGTPFQLKAGQGPTGGGVKRGGNYRTRADELRSSMRGEFNQFDVVGDNKGAPELGFRLVLAAPVFSDIERAEELESLLAQTQTLEAHPNPAADLIAKDSLHAPVHSTAHGIVVYARNAGGEWGNSVIVRHAYWANRKWHYIDSFYSHLHQIFVREGQQVLRGQLVGSIGTNNGMYPAHLHFEIRRNLRIGTDPRHYALDLNNYHRPFDFIAGLRRIEGGNRRVRVPVNTFEATNHGRETEQNMQYAATRSADGFDLPVGAPNANGYQRRRGVIVGSHMGEDWIVEGAVANSDVNFPAKRTDLREGAEAKLPPVSTSNQMKPPFGFRWGESVDRIVAVLDKSNAEVVQRERTPDGKEQLVVVGIQQEGLISTSFHFVEGTLSEVVLNFERPDWSEDRITQWVATVKKQADKQYGQSVSLTREPTESNEPLISGWQWGQGNSQMRLMHVGSREDGRSASKLLLAYSRTETAF